MINSILLLASEKSTVVFQSLNIFWKGMVAILIVITVIFLATMLMTSISAYLAKRKEQLAKIKEEIAKEKNNDNLSNP